MGWAFYTALGELKVTTGSGSSGAPTTAEYLVGALDGTLSAERLVTDTVTNAWNLATPGQAAVNGLPVAESLTIATGAITVANGVVSRVTIDTEGAAVTDDLDTINGGLNGQIVCFGTGSDARDVVFRHLTGNIINNKALDFTAGNNEDAIAYQKRGTNWVQLAPGQRAIGLEINQLESVAANTVLANATAGSAAATAVAVGANTVVGRVAGNIVAAALVNAQVDAAAGINLSKLEAIAANTAVVNATAGAAVPTALAVAAQSIVLRAAGNITTDAAAADEMLGRVASGDLGFNTRSAFGLFTGVTIQAFTAGGTYTPTSGMKFCIVIITGSGGGGGGADATGAADAGAGAGGGAGGTCIEAYSAATIGASQTITGGAAGTAGSGTGGTAGGNGGNWTFGALCTANGGTGGAGSGAGTQNVQVLAGGAGGVPSGGTLNITGGDGDNSMAFLTLDATDTNEIAGARGGSGGASFWGGGGRGGVADQDAAGADSTAETQAGTAGKAFGSGGGGGACLNTATGVAGGAGLLGCCLVIEFT